ncbi:MAG TPA: sugar ABC transporter permease [Candidatus Atribacteria bacterium]|nr:sugar ABC transporter permease [Candidatus Atribacteria bacterium]HPT78168.1 sugar ABC transporter permease [Candidatus Atribacteria bacterium]
MAAKRKKRRMGLEEKKAMMGYVFVLPFIIGLLTFFLFPMIQSFIFSLNVIEVVEGGYTLRPNGINYYKTALLQYVSTANEGKSFMTLIGEGLAAMATQVLLVVIFSFFAANLLNQKFRGRSVARAIFFLPVILMSGVIIAVDSGDLLQSSMGLTQTDAQEGSFQAVALARVLLSTRLDTRFVDFIVSAVNRIYEIVSASGVQILVFLAGLQSISPSLFEASNIEGATGWENFWKITFPMVSPLILVNTVYTVIDTLTNSNSVVMTIIRDEAFRNAKYGLSSAMAWIYFVAIMLVVAIITGIISRLVFYQE